MTELRKGFLESNRKTQAFWGSLFAVLALYGSSAYWHTEGVDSAIDAVTTIAVTYIAGVAATDYVRYSKYGVKKSKVEEDEEDQTLKDRYADK